MTNLTPELEAMVEPMAWKICEADGDFRCDDAICNACLAQARLAISLGARIKVPKSPGQRAFEMAYDVGWWIGTWEEMPPEIRSNWEQIAAAAREES